MRRDISMIVTARTRPPRALPAAALLAAVLVLSLASCSRAEQESARATQLAELAQKAAQGVGGERCAALEERLDRLERKLERIGTGELRPAAAGTEGGKEQEAATHSGSDEAAATDQGAGTAGGAATPPEVREFGLTISEPSPPVRIVVWHAYRGREKEAFEKCLTLFSGRYPGIETDAQEVPFSALRDKIVVTIPRGTGPDLFVYAHNNIGDWLLKGGILAPLSSYIEKYDSFDNLARFLPDTVKALAYEGTLYGLPLAFKSHALFYNRALVKEPPRTIEDLVRIGKEAQAAGGDGEERTQGLVYDAGLLYNHAGFAHAFGATILDEQGKAHIDTPEFQASAELVRDLFTNAQILPDLNDTMGTFLFNSGKAAFVIKGPWFLGEVDAGVEYGVALLPEVAEGKPMKPFLGSEGVFLSAGSRNPDAAFQVMRYLVSDVPARIRYLEGDQLVANLDVYEDAQLKARANPALDVFRRQAENTVIMSSRPEMQAVWSTVDNALRNALFGGADVKKTLAEAQAKVEHDIAGMGTK
ncbi:MAG: extracellular solute-binding protein [Deltaproteobacteria bacterium]|nr:extracellular solute-binding protein [Deltaproteobacteria bacterium]